MWSESVYLDVVSADGKLAVVTRLARHVDEGVAWLWLHAFGIADLAFVRDDLPCDAARTEDDDQGARYVIDGEDVRAAFVRSGPKDMPTGATVAVRVPGAIFEASFTPTGAAGSNLPGRSEVLGVVDASITTAEGTARLAARGQFHEQHQDAPRFTVPFTYGTLRGDGLGMVALITPGRSGGFVSRHDEIVRATSAAISPAGPSRRLVLSLERGGELEVDVRSTYDYELPINGRPRRSAIVHGRVGSIDVSGCINDWRQEGAVRAEN